MNAPKLPVRAEAGVDIGGYELVRRIGRGGMAEVWVARRALGRKGTKFVAIKLIADHYVGDERYCRMFRAEAELAAVLSHANIVQVFDEGEHQGRSFLIMEWVDGLNLRKLGAVLTLLDDERRRFRVTAYIIGQLLYALGYAHSITSFDGNPLGVVHRDVSPQNVLVSNHGEVKLTDFGVAHTAMEESSGVHVKGKVRYMAPEQLAGKTRSPTVDLYAVGGLLHELLDGRKFRGIYDDGQELLAAVLAGTLPPLSRPAPPELDDLRIRLLAPDPIDRIKTAEEAIAYLHRYPDYGDARGDLTKLCGSLTGIVRPRTGPAPSSPVQLAEQKTTPFVGRMPLAKPQINLRPERSPSPPAKLAVARAQSEPAFRTNSTTLENARSDPPAALITGNTECISPMRGPLANPWVEPLQPPTPHQPPQSSPSPGAPFAAPAAPSHPVPLGVQAPSSPPAAASHHPANDFPPPGYPSAPRAGGHPVDPGLLSTQRLEPSGPQHPEPRRTEVIDANMLIEMGGAGTGSNTDQNIMPAAVLRDGTETSRDLAPRSNGPSSSISSAIPKRSIVIAIIVMGLFMVAAISIGVTWWRFQSEQESPSSQERPQRADSSAQGPSSAFIASSTASDEPRPAPADARTRGDATPAGAAIGATRATLPEVDTNSPSPGPGDAPALAPQAVQEESPPTKRRPTEAPLPLLNPFESADVQSEAPEKIAKGSVRLNAMAPFKGAQVKVGSRTFTVPTTAKKKFSPGKKSVQWRRNATSPWKSAASITVREGKTITLLLTGSGPRVIR